jgi:GNAT superfamily N-acetyltransferase
MRREDLAFAIELAAREGWNPGLHDAECFFAADLGGFLIGERVGEPVGCISAVSYAGRYGFVGLYIVRPEYRGKGYGLRRWQTPGPAARTQCRTGRRLGPTEQLRPIRVPPRVPERPLSGPSRTGHDTRLDRACCRSDV